MIPSTVWRWALILAGAVLCTGLDVALGLWRDTFVVFFPFLLAVILWGTLPQVAVAILLTNVAGWWLNALHPNAPLWEMSTGTGMIILIAGSLALSVHRVRRLLREKDSLLVQEQQARSRAEEAYLAQLHAERKRDRLVQDAAHQLRTPMTVLTGYAQLLSELKEDEGNGPAGFRYRKGGGSHGATTSAVEKIVQSAQDMDAIVQNILDAARLPQGGADAWEDTLDPERPLPPDAQL